jgi:glycerophosphoryl diester phosphodiesterase
LGCPVNTVGAFQRAICRGVHQIELDVRATVDEVVVVAHDDQVRGKDQTLHISESTFAQVQELKLPPCRGDGEKNEHVPTLEEALAIMPNNIWINVDIKKNDPRVGQLVADIIAKAQRFDQVIFAARDKTTPAVRQVAENAGQKSWVANMSREVFRSQYIEATIHSNSEFIQLIDVPYLPFGRGTPSQGTMDRLKGAGVRVNYSWLRDKDEEELKQELQDLLNRRVDFVLVDHVEPAMKAAETVGISPLIPRWDHASSQTDEPHFHCPSPPWPNESLAQKGTQSPEKETAMLKCSIRFNQGKLHKSMFLTF